VGYGVNAVHLVDAGKAVVAPPDSDDCDNISAAVALLAKVAQSQLDVFSNLGELRQLASDLACVVELSIVIGRSIHGGLELRAESLVTAAGDEEWPNASTAAGDLDLALSDMAVASCSFDDVNEGLANLVVSAGRAPQS
jgi:hypothetical protein